MKKIILALYALAIFGCASVPPEKEALHLQATIDHAAISSVVTEADLALAVDAAERATTRPALIPEVPPLIKKAQAHASEITETLKEAKVSAIKVSDGIDKRSTEMLKNRARIEKLEESWVSPKQKNLLWGLGILGTISGGLFVYFRYFSAAGLAASFMKPFKRSG